ncbi:hypothetical protein I3843_01G129000 [Carya illinoinensis]|uniref:GDSL esterase/lipase n=1 Tax=Carya illinoinensis TaxID=32201 RepID=A0A922K5D9_CARIL|nr:hypothetical protein I3842_01G136400 [Carya illinoinensis]KAG7995823.1 hypothetical protein I3843_01G129000 [Carya illinoinensis]
MPGILTVSILVQICFAKTVLANFVFGDSLVEAGNYNYIPTLSRANIIPNGIDFGMPTGRFTNGRTIFDIVGQELGFKDFTPPYLAPTTTRSVVLQGVNYASGRGRILNQTGKIFTSFLSPWMFILLFPLSSSMIIEEAKAINFQVKLIDCTIQMQDIIGSIGALAALNLFGTALFSVTIGSNDFINNYLTPVISIAEQKLVSPQVFVGTMISRYRLQLTRLYDLGARKLVVANVGPIGCIPYQRDLNPTTGDNCVDFPNHLAQSFNAQLKSLITNLSTNLQGSKFVYADVYHIVADILQNFISYGGNNANFSCCYFIGRFGGMVPCGPSSQVCMDRSKYVFSDPYHPTDAANVIIVTRLMDGDSNDITPMNIRQLAEL